MKFLRTLATLGLIAALSYALIQPNGGPAIGSEAAPIVARQLNGETFKLSDHRERVVVIDFWATWCRPCRKTLPALQALHSRYARDDKVTIVSVSVDDPSHDSRVTAFMKRNRFNFKVIRDGRNRWSQAFNVRTIPYLLIIDGAGKIRSQIQHLSRYSVEEVVHTLSAKIEDIKGM